MTQVFSADNKVLPVTVIGFDHWFVTNIKTKERDGYDALQVGLLRDKYANKSFSLDWLKKPKHYFMHLREIKILDNASQFSVGQAADFAAVLSAGEFVNVSGITKGRGFQGVVKRLGFSGGRASHGPRFGRIPGSLSFMRSQGRVIKGKGLPGHMGTVKRMMRKLEVVNIEPDARIVIIKGSIPGSSGSLVYMQKV